MTHAARRWPWAVALACGVALLALDAVFPDLGKVLVGPRARGTDTLMRLTPLNVLGILALALAVALAVRGRLSPATSRRSALLPVGAVAGVVAFHHAALIAVAHWWPQAPAVILDTPEAHVEHARNTFFFGRNAEFSDMLETRTWFGADGGGNPYDAGTFYPPFALLIARVLSLLSVSYALAVILFLAALAVALGAVTLWPRNRAAALVLVPVSYASYPMLIAIERANLEIVALPFFAFAWLAFRRSHMAALFVAATGAAVKFFTWPLAWGTLRRRTWLSALLQVTAIAWIALLSCVVLGVPASSVLAPLDAFGPQPNGLYGLEILNIQSAVQFGSSLDAGAVFLTAQFAHGSLPGVVAFLESPAWTIAKGLVLVCGLVITLRGRGPDWALAAVPTSLVCLLPVFSPDYKLVFVLPVLYLLVRDWAGTRVEWVALASLALILAPQSWWYMPLTSASTSVPLKGGELVVLLGAAVATMYRHRRTRTAAIPKPAGEPASA